MYESSPSERVMQRLFGLCRADDFFSILQCVNQNRLLAVSKMTMGNNNATTILHQAITSKGETSVRAKLILTILEVAPKSAAIQNGNGSLPLHVIAQRNTKMDSSTKETIIHAMIKAYPDALIMEGGLGRRTPLHIIFTDYISPHLAKRMIERNPDATRMKDKKGWLPIHGKNISLCITTLCFKRISS
jgi:hypothetical protein